MKALSILKTAGVWDQIKDVLDNEYVKYPLGGAAVGGLGSGLAAYLGGHGDDTAEDPKARNKRIGGAALKGALMGGAGGLGAAALTRSMSDGTKKDDGHGNSTPDSNGPKLDPVTKGITTGGALLGGAKGSTNDGKIERDNEISRRQEDSKGNTEAFNRGQGAVSDAISKQQSAAKAQFMAEQSGLPERARLPESAFIGGGTNEMRLSDALPGVTNTSPKHTSALLSGMIQKLEQNNKHHSQVNGLPSPNPTTVGELGPAFDFLGVKTPDTNSREIANIMKLSPDAFNRPESFDLSTLDMLDKSRNGNSLGELWKHNPGLNRIKNTVSGGLKGGAMGMGTSLIGIPMLSRFTNLGAVKDDS